MSGAIIPDVLKYPSIIIGVRGCWYRLTHNPPGLLLERGEMPLQLGGDGSPVYRFQPMSEEILLYTRHSELLGLYVLNGHWAIDEVLALVLEYRIQRRAV